MEGENWTQFLSGFLMANNCGIISQNGLTEYPNQARPLSPPISSCRLTLRCLDVQRWLQRRSSGVLHQLTVRDR